MANIEYVHGYDLRENERLHHQGEALADLLHDGLRYGAGSHVLEAGSGTGAQTLQLLRRHPGTLITCVERDASSIAAAAAMLDREPGREHVKLVQADLQSIHVSLPAASFDHLFVCFVLEHLSDPVAVLQSLLSLVKAGGSITVIEGDHGTTCFHPDSAEARAVIDCQVKLQRAAGGNALIGRRLYPLLVEAGIGRVNVEPRLVYVDGSRPDLAKGFTLGTFTAMIAGMRPSALAAHLITADTFDRGIAALARSSEADGVFCYTFYRAHGTKLGAELPRIINT